MPPQTGRGPGDLVYVRDGGIEVRAFDTAHAALAGDAHRLDAEAGGPTPYHPSMLSASSDVMAFVASSIPFGAHLGFVARNGDGFKLQPESEVQNWPRLSPDGHWLARQRIDVVRGNPDIWVEDIARGTGARVTTDPVAEDVARLVTRRRSNRISRVGRSPTDGWPPEAERCRSGWDRGCSDTLVSRCVLRADRLDAGWSTSGRQREWRKGCGGRLGRCDCLRKVRHTPSLMHRMKNATPESHPTDAGSPMCRRSPEGQRSP